METSKKDSSQRQIEEAIRLFHDGKLDCAITLAAAAEGILPETDAPYLFNALRPYNDELELNMFINWLKHPGGPEHAVVGEFEAAIVIARALSKFIAVHRQASQPILDFMQWGYEAGHLPAAFATNSN